MRAAVATGNTSGTLHLISVKRTSAPGITFRLAEVGDANRIATINVRAWQRAYRGLLSDALLDSLSITGATRGWVERLKSDRARVWLLEDNDEVCGFASIGVSTDKDADAETAELYTIYLDPDYAGKGLGKALLRKVIKDLRNSNYKECTVWVLTNNERAKRFYERAGFVEDHSEETFVLNEHPLHETRYRLNLDPEMARIDLG